MKNSTSLFLAYMNYKAGPNPKTSFEEYVSTKPDLAATILVSMVARDMGIELKRPGRGRRPGVR